MGRVVLEYKNLSSLLYKAGHSVAVDFGERMSKQTENIIRSIR